jgi:hypothetical protein
VTSGYVISPGFIDEDPITHFDVIIYDKLDSPVLWRENNPDLSEQGCSRPIPVEHVLAVLEVKSTLTKATASDAIGKLYQLAPLLAQIDNPDEYYPKYLSSKFICGVVFFKADSSNRTSVLTPLIAPELRGYFGGVVLSSSADPFCAEAGQIQLTHNEDPVPETNETVLSSVITFPPSREVAGQHFSVLLMWHPNSFAFFAYELLARLRGTYRPGFAASGHGTSYISG